MEATTDQPKQPPINAHDPETQALPQDDAVSGVKRKREDEEGGPGKHPLWKTSLCSFFRRQDASCEHGTSCPFAHSEAELRPRPDNTWDPTSERAKKTANKSGEEDERECAEVDEVMMTEAMDGDDGLGSDLALSKYLIHLPRNWKLEKFKYFLSEQSIRYKSAKKKPGMALGFISLLDIIHLWVVFWIVR